jgi:hypothetical protein
MSIDPKRSHATCHNGDVIAFDHRGHRLGIDVRHARQDAALAGDQHVATDARRRRILLHAGIFGAIAFDCAGMIVGLDDRDESGRARVGIKTSNTLR